MRVIITQFAEAPPVPAAFAGALSAQPGGITGALELPSRINEVTNAASGTGVRAKVIGGNVQEVLNRAGADFLLFPADGTQFEGYGTNVPVTVPFIAPIGGGVRIIWNGVSTWRLA